MIKQWRTRLIWYKVDEEDRWEGKLLGSTLFEIRLGCHNKPVIPIAKPKEEYRLTFFMRWDGDTTQDYSTLGRAKHGAECLLLKWARNVGLHFKKEQR